MIGVRSGADVIRLFPAALRVLQVSDERDPTSSRWPPRRTRRLRQLAQAALDILEIVRA